MFAIVAIVFCHLFAAAFAAANGVTPVANGVIRLQLSESPPANTSSAIDPSFAGFGIEPSNLFSFTGQSVPNKFTLNVLDNLATYAGKPPHIRIGGNTQDYMVYNENIGEWSCIENRDPTGPGSSKSNSLFIGPRFFDAANRLPMGTPVTWGLNMAYVQDDYIEQVTMMAKQVLSACSNLTITSFEIGNEPDLYAQNGFRTGQWGGKIYTQQWLDRATAIYEQVLQPKGMPSNFFEAAATASTIGTDFQITDLMGFGIDKQVSDNLKTSYLSGWNQHDYYYYLGVSGYPVTLDRLMKLQTTEVQFEAWLEQVKQAQQTPYPYALREMGLVGPIGLEGVTNVFGAALWTLNFLLYTASYGVSSVGFHMTDNSNASAWQPITNYGLPPHVRPVYYGIAAFDEVIGSSCASQVSQYPITQISEEYDGYVRAYAVYQAKQLASVVVVNGKMANSSQAQKDHLTVQLHLPMSLANQTVYLAHLTNQGADATMNTTWNGISFEQSGDGTPTQVSDDGQTVEIASDGTASFSVRDTEAVVASFGKKVGSGTESGTCGPAPGKTPHGDDSSQPPSSTTSGTDEPTKPASASLLQVSLSLVFGVLMLWISIIAAY
ncbi:glycoside hydrolase superfamily [Hypoxylon fuscum]|nr:glycoside hydrolase superfamily [Hypoxylon fuscum]